MLLLEYSIVLRYLRSNSEKFKFLQRPPTSESVNSYYSDAEVLKHGDRTGLDTPVVHAFNDEYSTSNNLKFLLKISGAPLRCQDGIKLNTNSVFNSQSCALEQIKKKFKNNCIGGLANAENTPPEKYGRKAEIQRD